MNNDSKIYLTAKETAQFLGVSLKYLYQLTHQRKIPYYSPSGRKILFKRTELISYVEGARIASADDIRTQAHSSIISKGGALC